MAVRREEVVVTARIDNFTTKMAAASASAGAFADRLDEADGRMANLVQSTLAFGPALVPLGAAAVPAIAGLTTQLGFAGLAAGVAVLAFQGVGDAMKAVNDYKLDPSVANFEKMQAALEKIGPAGAEFVVALQRMKPALSSLQNLAREGLLPGAAEGLNELMRILPQVQAIVSTVARTMGDLLAEGGKNLAGPRFEEFFDYLAVTARPILTDMGRTLGNFFDGFTNMVVAFDPLSRSFSSGFLEMSRSFVTWSEGLSSSQGFAEFVDYVREAGPLAMDALGSIGDALVALVGAAAPVGRVVLPIISALADALAALASSPIGPPLIAAAAAVGVLGRSLAVLQAVGLRGGQGGFLAATLGTDKMKAALPTLAQTGTYINRLGQSADNASQKTLAARSAVGGFARAAAPAGAAVAGLGIAMSGAADKFGLTNTATYALMGTLAGPWGAAIGGAAGLAMDFAAANDDVEAAVRRSGEAVASSSRNFQAAKAALDASQRSLKAYQASLPDQDDGFFGSVGESFYSLDVEKAVNDFTELVTGSAEKTKKAVSEQQAAFTSAGATIAMFAKNAGFEEVDPSNLDELTAAAERLRPAFADAGVDMDNLVSRISQGGIAGAMASAEYAALRAQLDVFGNNADSAAAKSGAIGQALRELEGGAVSAADGATVLQGALDSLFGTAIDRQAATDAYTQSIRDLGKQLRESNGDLSGQTKAGLENRAAMRDAAQAMLTKVDADAKAGVAGDKLALSLVKGREALIRAGVAAGNSREYMEEYVATLGLTPKSIETTIMASGVLSATQKVQALTELYGVTPRELTTAIKAVGADPTMATVRRVAKQLGIHPKQLLTLIKARDDASPKIKTAKRNAVDLARGKYEAALKARDDASPKTKAAKQKALDFARAKYQAALKAEDRASAVAAAARRAALTFAGTYTARFITTRQVVNIPAITKPRGTQEDGGLLVNGVRTFADGGFSEGGRYHPRTPQIVAGGANILWGEKSTGWEAYISGKPSMQARNMEVWRQAGERLGARFVEYANGGLEYGSRLPLAVTPAAATSAVSEARNGTTVAFYGPVNNIDTRELAREVDQRQRMALMMARA